ncbi:MAG TPA: hypothetical protein PKD28_00145 [Candidatus Saccharibacteria bacterium]|nr:hypothetical protein [Candidatus Saccharibacteria bacterium]
MNEQKQKSPSIAFIDAVRKVDRDTLDQPIADDDPLLDMLEGMAIDSEPLSDEEVQELKEKKLHRKERAFVRGLAEKAALSIQVAAGEDVDLGSELTENLRRNLGSIGINPNDVRGLRVQKEESTPKDRGEAVPGSHVPAVLEKHRAPIDEIEVGTGLWSARDTRAVTKGFLDTYLPVQDQLDKKRFSGGGKLDAIATVNAFSHAFVKRLASLPNSILATGAINDVETGIVDQLELRADDFRRRRITEAKQGEVFGELPEIQTLRRRVLDGVRTEFIAHKLLDKHKNELGMTEVAFSSTEQDVKEGWDLSLTHESGTRYYIDVKRSGAFRDLIEKSDQRVTAIPGLEGVVIKQNAIVGPVVVIAADDLAGIRPVANRLEATSGNILLESIKDGIIAIDNIRKE